MDIKLPHRPKEPRRPRRATRRLDTLPRRMIALTAHIENHTMKAANTPRPRREVADENVAQANENHEKMSAAAAEATRLTKNTYSTTFKGTQEYSTKVLEFAHLNTDAAFEYVRQLSSV